MKYITYSSDGAITQASTSRVFDSDLEVNDSAYYNCYVDISTKTLVPMPAKPSNHHIFNYATKQWEDPRTLDTQWADVRNIRDRRLAETDWVTARAYELGTAVPINYATYRQALRDVTNQPDPFNITWPVLENAQ